jgi:integrase
MIFEALVQQFETSYLPRLAKPTRAKYMSLLTCHVKPEFASLELEQVNTKRIDAWLESKTRDGLAWATRSDLRNLISSIFTRAEIWEMWDGRNPAKRANAGRKKAAYEKRRLTTHQTTALLNKLPDDVRIVCMVALFCGLRISEVLGLCWKHVDFARRMLLIRQRYYRGDVDRTKSDKADRDVPYGDLDKLLRARWPGADGAEAFCFEVRTIHGVTRDDSTLRRYYLRPAAEELGLYYRGFGFHAFRREAVTAISSIAGAIQACRVAGHSRMDTTLLYGLDDYALQEKAIRKIQKGYAGLLR